jgi:signal transduction histidine kinase
VLPRSPHSLLAVINDILDFSRIEAGKIAITSSRFCIRQEIAATLKMMGINARQKSLSLSACVSPDVPEEVRGDAGRLRQVLLNLRANAIKFTGRGTVSLFADVEHLSATMLCCISQSATQV